MNSFKKVYTALNEVSEDDLLTKTKKLASEFEAEDFSESANNYLSDFARTYTTGYKTTIQLVFDINGSKTETEPASFFFRREDFSNDDGYSTIEVLTKYICRSIEDVGRRHITSDEQFLLINRFVDEVGEETFYKIADAIGKGKSFKGITLEVMVNDDNDNSEEIKLGTCDIIITKEKVK